MKINGDVLISVNENDVKFGKVTIPEGVRAIGDYAFAYCIQMTTVFIPSTVEKIGRGAFYQCSGLKVVSIPDSVKVIYKNCFEGCDLTDLLLPKYCIGYNCGDIIRLEKRTYTNRIIKKLKVRRSK